MVKQLRFVSCYFLVCFWMLTLCVTGQNAYSKPLIPYLKGNNYGFSDPDGRIILAPKYEDATRFYGGLAAVKNNGKWGFIDTTGKQIIPYKFDMIWFGEREFITVKVGSKSGMIDRKGTFIIQPKYDGLYHYDETEENITKNRILPSQYCEGVNYEIFYDYLVTISAVDVCSM